MFVLLVLMVMLMSQFFTNDNSGEKSKSKKQSIVSSAIFLNNTWEVVVERSVKKWFPPRASVASVASVLTCLSLC